MDKNLGFCVLPQTLMKMEHFEESLKGSEASFSEITNFKNVLKILENPSKFDESHRIILNDFLKEIQMSLNSLKITNFKLANYQKFYDSISLIHAVVFLKKVFLKEKISINCQFAYSIYLIYFLKLYRKSKEKKNRYFTHKEIQEKFLDTMFIFSKNYLDHSSTGSHNFFKVNTNIITAKHENNEFFESISTKLSDQTHENFLVLENLGLILFSKLLKTMRFNEEMIKEKQKTELFLQNFLNSCLKVCSNLIDLTLKTQEISINLIQSLMNNILKIMVKTLSVKLLDDILYEKLKNDGFKEIKFLMKVVFIILFDDVYFEEFEISKKEFEIFQPNKQQIKTLIKVIHLNSKQEKLKVFESILQVRLYYNISINICFLDI